MAVAQLLREMKVLRFCDPAKLMPVSLEMIVEQMLITESRAAGEGEGGEYKREYRARNGPIASPRFCS